MTELPARIASKFTIDPATGCWLWHGAIGGTGYAHARIDGRTQPVHRVIYELLVGPIPSGLQIDHLCRVRHCVNPDHLEPVTHAENWRRGEGGAPQQQAAMTHCMYGHPLDEANTYRYHGHRQCRACKKLRSQQYDERHREQRRDSARSRRRAKP